MPDDVLSPAELESLHRAARSRATRHSTGASTWRRGETQTRFDPQHDHRGDDDLASMMRTLHESFARGAAAGLGSLARSTIGLEWIGMEQLTYDRFLFGLQNPTCLQLLHAPPLPGHLILELHPAIVYPLIDRLLGGGRESGPPARRPLTQIELRLSRRISDVLLAELRQAWAGVVALEPVVIGIESHPQHLPMLPPGDAALLVRFELAVGEARGPMNLCLTQPALAEVEKLLRGRAAAIGGAATAGGASLVVRLPDIRLPSRDLRALRAGDVIATDQDCSGPWLVEFDGRATFTARPGSVQGRKAIRIEGKKEGGMKDEG